MADHSPSPYSGMTARDAAIARAVEDVFAGASIRAAARREGIEPTAIHRAVRRDARYVPLPQREAMTAEAKMEAIALRRQAARVTAEGLDSGEITPGQAAVVYGIASDKLVSLDRIDRPAPRDAIGELLARIQDGGTVSVSVAPSPRAIDVTPEHE